MFLSLPLGEPFFLQTTVWTIHIPGQTELLHPPDEPAGRIQHTLPGSQTMVCRARKSMVVVVPGLAKRQRCQRRTIGAAVVILVWNVERTRTEHMANGVDTPREVMCEHHAH